MLDIQYDTQYDLTPWKPVTHEIVISSRDKKNVAQRCSLFYGGDFKAFQAELL